MSRMCNERRYGLKFVQLDVGQTFLFEGRFYRKIEPVVVGFTPSRQPRTHNCIDEKGKSTFLPAPTEIWPVTFAEVRSGGGKLLFKYAAEYGLVEIKPKGAKRPLLVKLDEGWAP